MADDGTSVTPCNVFTSRRVLTNWFGKSASFLLSKSARPFTVPVVVSIWLSSVNSFPLAIFFCAVRSKASTASLAPLRKRASTWPRLSSGIVKITVMGSNCVMTARVVVPADCTTLPGSTSRKPTRPAMGAVMWQ